MTPQYFQVGEEVIIHGTGLPFDGDTARIVSVQFRGGVYLNGDRCEPQWLHELEPEPMEALFPQKFLRKKPKPATGSYDEIIGWVKMGCPKRVLEHE